MRIINVYEFEHTRQGELVFTHTKGGASMNPRERDFKILASLWGEDNYFLVNKKIMRKLGASKTIILSLFFDMWRYCKGEEFFYLNKDLQALTHHDERTIRKEVRELVEAGYIIKTRFAKFDGSPKQYFVLDTEKIIELLVSEEEDSLTPTKMQGLTPTKMQGSYYNNNYRDNNNRDINTDSNAHASDALERSFSKSHQKAYSKRYTNEEIDSAFESFWLKYPKKENKQEAKKAYINALNGVYTARALPRSTPISIEELQNAVEAYSKHLEATGKLGDKGFLPNATTWLNNQRYDNSYSETTSTPEQAIQEYNRQHGLKGDSAIKGYYNLPRHLQEERSGNWEQYAPKTEEERKERERIAKELLGWEY